MFHVPKNDEYAEKSNEYSCGHRGYLGPTSAAHAAQEAEYGAQETVWSLSLQPRRKWLGMTVEPAAVAAYSPPSVVAYCLNDMTFHGFSEAENQELMEELHRRVAEIDAMSVRERAERLIPAEKVLAELKAKFRIDE
jgi:hypothetical protein